MIKPRKSVENMNGYFVPLYERSWDLKIDSNENNYGPSPKVLEAIKNCNISDISYYPYYGELSEKIAIYQGFSIDNIKVTNGADEAIQAVIQTYLEPGEYTLTLDTSFEMPVIYTQIQGGQIIKVPYKEKWVFPVDEFLRELNNPGIKIIYIASPNNPTGNIIKENDLRKIIERASDKVVIIDETYANYSGSTYKDLVKEYDNVFLIRSFSKDFALAGIRLGYIISNKENINNLRKVVSPFSVNSLAMLAGIEALNDIGYFYSIKKEILDSKKELKMFFETLGAEVYDSEANFLLADFKQKSEFIYNRLIKENIAVKIYKTDGILKNHLRITIPTKEGVKKIKNALKIKPCLVFDMDGVLINAANSYRVTIQKTYENYTGKTVSSDEIQSVKNLGGYNNDWDLTKYLLDKEGLNVSYGEIVDMFQKIYWNNGEGLINNENILFNKAFFEELSKEYNLSIFTGRLRKEAMYALKKFNADSLFFPIITTDDIPHGKGKPDPFGLNLTKEMTISDSYYYFGDTPDDILAAKAAGYTPVGVLPPQDKSEELKQTLQNAGAKFVIDSINNLKSILEQKNEAVC